MNRTIHIIICSAALFSAGAFFAAKAEAATLYFEPSSQTIGTGGSFVADLLVDAVKPVNAFDVSVSIPDGLDVTDASDGNSIITFWVVRPAFDAASRKLTFAGIVPNGFSGTGGLLLRLYMSAKHPGAFGLSYDPATKLLLNNPDQAEDSVMFETADIAAVAGKENLSNAADDTTPPEPFTPFLATSSSVFGGQWAVYWNTVDKGSGLAGYEVAESSGDPGGDRSSLSWHEAESPYLLSDQSLSSFVFVKATDKAGNERVEAVPPRKPYPEPLAVAFLSAVLVISFGLFMARLRSRKRLSGL